MFLKFLSAAAAVSFLLTPLSASADPRADVAKMAKTFFAVTSFHCDVTGPGSRKMSVDFVAPDRFRTELPGGKEAVIIGSDMWMPLGGRSIKLPGIAAPVKMYLEQIRNLSFGGVIEQAYDITDNGTATLNGVRTHMYTLVKHGEGIPVKMWIGRNSLPVQEIIMLSDGIETVHYSAFNSPLAIDHP